MPENTDKNVKIDLEVVVNGLSKVKELKQNISSLDKVTKKVSNFGKGFLNLGEDSALKQFQNGLVSVSSATKDINKGWLDLGTNDGIKQFQNRLVSVSSATKDINKDWLDLGTNDGIKKFGLAIKTAENSINTSKQAITRFSLGIMFFGMAIQRLMNSITKSSLDTFTKIIAGSDELSRSLNPAYTALNALGGEFEYLRFSIGQALGTALEPLMEKITGLIDGFARFASAHPKLISSLIILFSVIGGSLFLFGTLSLGIHSVIDAFASVSAVTNIFKISIAALGGATIGQLALFAAMVVAIALVIWWINDFKNKLGGWKNFFISFVAGVIKAIMVVPSVFETVVESIGIAFDNLFNRIQQLFFKLVSWLSKSKLGNMVLEVTGLDAWLDPSRYNIKETVNDIGSIWSKFVTKWQNNSETFIGALGIDDNIAAMQDKLATSAKIESTQGILNSWGVSTPQGTTGGNTSNGAVTNNVTINAYGSSIASVEAQSNEYMAMYQKFLNSNGYIMSG